MAGGAGNESVLAVGDVLDGKYAIGELLARGGMADVHRAHDVGRDRPVAVKAMRVDTGDQRRFARESRVLADLDHSNLVRLLAVGHHEGRPYMVMDLVDGPSLAVRLEEGPLDLDAGRRLGRDVASALAYVHGQGVIHRDVKPSNILLEPDGHARLTDFGVVWLSDGTQLTETSSTIGTMAFLAPEQIGGGNVSAAVDVYALGLVLLEAMSGQHAFAGTQQEILAARLVRNPDIPASLPPSWRRLLRAMTARDPAERPEASVISGYLDGITTKPGAGPLPVVGSTSVASADAPAGPPEPVHIGPDDPTTVMRPSDVAPTSVAPAAAAPATAAAPVAAAGGGRSSGAHMAARPDEAASRQPFILLGGVLAVLLIAGVFLVASLGGESPVGSEASGATTSIPAVTTTSTTTTTTTTTTTLPPTTTTTTPPVVTGPPGDGDGDWPGRPGRRCRRLAEEIEEIDEQLEEIADDPDFDGLEAELRERREEAEAERDELDC